MFKKKLTMALLSSVLLFQAIFPASIDLAHNYFTNITLSKFNSYVKVKKNQYVLQLPEGAQVSAVDIMAVSAHIRKANTIVIEDSLIKNSETKVASTSDFSLYSAGINKVTFHWNYVRVYLSKTTINNVISGATGDLGVILDGVPG